MSIIIIIIEDVLYIYRMCYSISSEGEMSDNVSLSSQVLVWDTHTQHHVSDVTLYTECVLE